jgi:hypothetical protein
MNTDAWKHTRYGMYWRVAYTRDSLAAWPASAAVRDGLKSHVYRYEINVTIGRGASGTTIAHSKRETTGKTIVNTKLRVWHSPIWVNHEGTESFMICYSYTECPRRKGHSIGHSKQKVLYTCVLFRTVSEIELFYCTVYRRATRHVLTRVAKLTMLTVEFSKMCHTM